MALKCNHSDSLTHFIHPLTLVLIEFLPLHVHWNFCFVFVRGQRKIVSIYNILLTLCPAVGSVFMYKEK